MALFFDNLAVHKTKVIREKCKELGIPILFNVPYQPDYNPVECCISKMKNYFKKEKLRRLVEGETIDYTELIK